MGEAQNAYDIKATLDSKDTANTNLQDLFKQINELKDSDSSNDAIDNVFDANNQLNNSLKTALEGFKAKNIRTLVTELWKIENDTSLRLDGTVKDSIRILKNLLQNTLNEKQAKPDSLKEFEWYINEGKLNKLNKLNSKEIGEIVKFIEDGGLEEGDIIILYNKMNDCKRNFVGRFLSTDNENFTKVLSALQSASQEKLSDERTAIDSEVSLHLDKIFSGGQDAESLLKILESNTDTDTWDGSDISNISFKDNTDRSARIQPNDFIRRFNQENQKRINWAKEEWIKFIGKSSNKIQFNDDWNINLGSSKQFLNEIKNLIINDEELNSDHFKAVRENWKKAYDAAVEAEAKKGWKNIEKNSKEFGKQTETWIKEINGFLKENDQQFLKIEGADSNTTISYNLEKAKIYLKSLLKVGEQDATRNNFKTKTGPERKAWIAAVQIALNNLTGVTDDNKIKVDGIDQQQTENAVKKFQTDKDLTSKDGKPWPETIKALLGIDDSSSESSDESSGKIDNPENLGLTKKPDINDKNTFNIPDNAAIYSKDGDNSWIYYKSWNHLVRVSTDEPRVKESIAMPTNTNNSWDMNNATLEKNVCAKWVDALNNKIKYSTNEKLKKSGLSFSEKDNSYQLLHMHNNTTISIPDGFFNKEFCWLTKMEDKLMLFILADEVSNIVESNNSEQFAQLIESQLATRGFTVPTGLKRDQFRSAFDIR